MKQNQKDTQKAMEETLRLYHAWLGYLLGRLGESTLHVKVEDIRQALNDFRCSVCREGDEYVICLRDKEETHGAETDA